MKFAQYLRDTQTPEWKKAYIDYRGLKKRITAIRKAQQGVSVSNSPSDSPDGVVTPPSTPRISDATCAEPTLRTGVHDSPVRISLRRPSVSKPEQAFSSGVQDPVVEKVRRGSILGGRQNSHQKQKSLSSRLGGSSGRTTNPLATLPLHDILLELSPQEIAFVNLLDAQLEKVESFYISREQEMVTRAQALQTQLHELVEHRKIYLQAHSKVPWAAAVTAALKPGRRNLKITRTISVNEARGTVTSMASHKRPTVAGLLAPTPLISRVPSASSHNHSDEEKSPQSPSFTPPLSEDEGSRTPPQLSADPDSYLYAKRKLKKAVIEHYRGLELLHNYRVLNITGFRKALKKFEKTTKISIQNQYMLEKIEKSAFASDKVVSGMMRDMEELYAHTFVKGNKKKALKRLRGGNQVKSHHFSTFRSGIWLGLAIPAMIAGFIEAFKPENRSLIDGWGALMTVYATLFVPSLFVLLVGLNLLVWARSRINYIFIFELNTNTALDYREYFETPSMLLTGLAYCFWLSFARVGAPSVSPTAWPMIWLGATVLLVLNPVHVSFHHSRFWLLGVISKLFLTGTRRVEFTDFWMGDQFCSLVYPLSNLYFVGCMYANGFDGDWHAKCGSRSKYWIFAFILAILPFWLRLVQSFKRFFDSGLLTHLINGGKYGAGIVSQLLFFLWRHYGTQRSGALFAFWCICNTISAVYACTWDFLMDWSVLKLHSPNILLRPELVYSSHTSFYYLAIVTNALLRFSWVLYLPESGPDIYVRSFIVALLELLRRWQWNFYRLENEHLGNMDQYRVTREVPLPYLFDDPRRGDDPDDDDDEVAKAAKR